MSGTHVQCSLEVRVGCWAVGRVMCVSRVYSGVSVYCQAIGECTLASPEILRENHRSDIKIHREDNRCGIKNDREGL